MVASLHEDDRVVWSAPPLRFDDDALHELLAELQRRLDRGDPYVLVFDLSHVGLPTARQRQAMAAHMRDNRDKIRRRVRAIGVVAPSPVLRGLVTAVFWMEPPTVPHQIFATRFEADLWARAVVAPS